MFTSLWHWTVSCTYYQDCTVHLRCTCDHVFYIVSMTRAVYVGIMTFVCFIFYVCSINCDTTFSFFWCFVDFIEFFCFCQASLCQYCCDCCCSCGLTMVYVTNGTNVYVRFCTFVLFFCHFLFLLYNCRETISLYVLR